MIDGATYFAWFVLAFLFVLVVIAIVYLGSLPGKIARNNNHPQAAAINAASWWGLALGGIGWPFAFVWAMVRKAPMGHSSGNSESDTSESDPDEVVKLKTRIASLEAEVKSLRGKQK